MVTLVERFYQYCKDVVYLIYGFGRRVQDLFFLNDELTVFGFACVFLFVSFLFVGLLVLVREKLQLR